MGVKSDGEGRGMESLLAAKMSLQNTLQKSRDLAVALEKTGPRLEVMSRRLPELEAAVGPMRNHRKILFGIGNHIDRAVGPAAELLKVFNAVHGLEKSLLSDPRTDIWGYLAVVKRLEEALKFLAENCGEATQWLQDIVDHLEKHSVGERNHLPNLKKSLENLRALQAAEEEKARLDGGLLQAALDKLEDEFKGLLAEHTVALKPSPPPLPSERPCIAPSPLPGPVVQKLQAILERLTVNSRLNRCLKIYMDLRSANAKASLAALGLDYLATEFVSVENMEAYVARWAKDLEFAVKHVLDAEYRLCGEVYEKIGPDVWVGCFGQIALEAGMLEFLRFAETVADSKPNPIKLLKLLDIFEGLNRLRPDFNKLFGGKACFEIQNRTRDIVKKVIEGSCEIFRELLTQVELQRQRPAPANGGVPMLVSFLVGFCNQLLEDRYRAVLTQVLVIERSWRRERFQEKILTEGIINIVRALDVNLDTWCKSYEDPVLSHLFMMNNHWHFYVHANGTKLGDLMGEPWLREHQQYKEYYAVMYFKDSWGKIPALLSGDGLITFSGGRATARDLLKKRLRAFNEAVDGLYRKHATWIIPDKELRESISHSVVQKLVPVYRSYMQSYGPLVEQEESPKKYAKYTAHDLEWMLVGLFQQTSQKPMNGTAKFNRTVSLDPSNSPMNGNGKANLLRTSSAVI
uniref:Exocyst subunit Exo70 family protein n=1 Tax=Araucaria cunninghamii TaxID=56994 RepID=A0A0D6R475_ARACU